MDTYIAIFIKLLIELSIVITFVTPLALLFTPIIQMIILYFLKKKLTFGNIFKSTFFGFMIGGILFNLFIFMFIDFGLAVYIYTIPMGVLVVTLLLLFFLLRKKVKAYK